MTDGADTKTALITGASSGLGEEFACQLASLGYNLVLSARREELLIKLKDSLQSRYPVDVLVKPADLSKMSEIDSLVEQIASLPRVDMLVHSAGFGTVGRFNEVDPCKELSMLNVHMVAQVMLCRAALPGMLSRKQGGIIAVASIAGLIPIRNVLYHATKTFQIHFCEVLQVELRGTGVHVQALCPGYTITGFHDTSEYDQFARRSVPRFLWMTSAQVVTESLKALPRDKLYCFPGPYNKIAGSFARFSLTAGVVKRIGRWVVYRQKAL